MIWLAIASRTVKYGEIINVTFKEIRNKMHLDITIRSNVQIKGNQLSIDPGGTPVA